MVIIIHVHVHVDVLSNFIEVRDGTVVHLENASLIKVNVLNQLYHSKFVVINLDLLFW